MNEEEKEAIDNLKLNATNNGFSLYDGTTNIFRLTDIQTLLKLIEKQKAELDKKDRIIENMTKYISKLDIDEDICSKNIINPQLCNEKYSNCNECIKEYFEKKVGEE